MLLLRDPVDGGYMALFLKPWRPGFGNLVLWVEPFFMLSPVRTSSASQTRVFPDWAPPKTCDLSEIRFLFLKIIFWWSWKTIWFNIHYHRSADLLNSRSCVVRYNRYRMNTFEVQVPPWQRIPIRLNFPSHDSSSQFSHIAGLSKSSWISSATWNK